MRTQKIAVLAAIVLAAACGRQQPAQPDAAALEFRKQLQTRLITARPGDVITIPAGVHPITRGLSLNVPGVTIRGEGMDKSVLSFKGQVQGAEGLLVNAGDFTIEDLAIEDTADEVVDIAYLVRAYSWWDNDASQLENWTARGLLQGFDGRAPGHRSWSFACSIRTRPSRCPSSAVARSMSKASGSSVTGSPH